MPLLHSGSDAALHKNMHVLMSEIGKSPHVQSRAQAIAIGLSNQRRYGHASGGVVGYDSGGAVQDVIQALSAGSGAPVSAPTAPASTTSPASPAVGAAPAAQGVAPASGQTQAQPAPAAPGAVPPVSSPGAMLGVLPAAASPVSGATNLLPVPQPAPTPAPATPAPAPAQPLPDLAIATPQGVEPAKNVMSKQLMAHGGVAHSFAPGGVPGALGGTGGVGPMNMAKAPTLQTPWFERRAESGMTKGPILSAVPGRTDAHQTHVPSGSYVIPADVVSGKGQGNTLAGAAHFMQMFKMGPWGAPSIGMTHGPGAPKPPRPMHTGMMHSGGGKGGDDDMVGTPTRVNLAGGEIVVPPENLMSVVNPNLNIAHQIMDHLVVTERKNIINEMKHLPGPAQD